MLDVAWRPGVDFASGLTAYYAEHEAHLRKLADEAYREWQDYLSLAEKYRLLEEGAQGQISGRLTRRRARQQLPSMTDDGFRELACSP